MDDALLAQIALQQKILLKTPHSIGDHTDLCRFHNGGLPPDTDEHCRCHVAQIQHILNHLPQSAALLLQVVECAKQLIRVMDRSELTHPAGQNAWMALQQAIQQMERLHHE